MNERDLPKLSDPLRALLDAEAKHGVPTGLKAVALARITDALATAGAGASASGGSTGGPGPTEAAGPVGAGNATSAAGTVVSSTAKIVIALVGGITIGSAVTAAITTRAPLAPTERAVASAIASVAPPTSLPVVPVTPALREEEPASLDPPVTPSRSAPSSSLVSRPMAPPSVSPASPRSLAMPARTREVEASGAAPSGSSEAVIDRSLADERRILERARSALSRKDASAAIDAATEHETRFPRGQLAAERDAILVQSLAMANRHAEAVERAARFRATYPNNVLTPVVDKAILPSPK